MRAIEPAQSGQLRVCDFQIAYEAFGNPANSAVLLLPPWQIVNSRIWKMQVPFLARFHWVVTLDVAGHGKGQSTCDPRAFEYQRIVDQAIGVLDHLEVESAHVVGFSRGCAHAMLMAATYPARVNTLVLLAGKVSGGWHVDSPTGVWDVARPDFWERRESYSGWEKYNAHFWRDHYQEWLEFFFNEVFLEPHSTKAVDDCITWAWETDPDTLIAATSNPALLPELSATEAIERIRCPVLMIHGTEDRCSPIRRTEDLAKARPEWLTVVIDGAGHAPMVRDPVKVNLLLRDFFRCGSVSAARKPPTESSEEFQCAR